MRELKCLSATGQLGHGIIADAFRAAWSDRRT